MPGFYQACTGPDLIYLKSGSISEQVQVRVRIRTINIDCGTRSGFYQACPGHCPGSDIMY